MFGIGSTELLVIFVVALIVLGPKSIPQIAKTLGKAMGEFKRVSTEFQRTMNAEVENEEHEKRKKEAEEELFGKNKSAPASPAAPQTANAEHTTDPVPATAQTVSAPNPTEAAADSSRVQQAEAFAPDSPLAQAVAKAEAEAAAKVATPQMSVNTAQVAAPKVEA